MKNTLPLLCAECYVVHTQFWLDYGKRGCSPDTLQACQEGKVIVEIRVNAAGTVVSAKHKGGTISDRATIQLAIDAALKAKFTEGDHDQIGTITYNFKFN